jgi:hypothetical protein
MHAPITFDYIGQIGQGVSLSDFSALSQSALGQMVAGAYDQVLAKTGVNKINLRIMVSLMMILNLPRSDVIMTSGRGTSI